MDKQKEIGSIQIFYGGEKILVKAKILRVLTALSS